MSFALVTGGVRSGKSAFAERLAAESAHVVYVATAAVDPTDAEMAARIARHTAARRDRSWRTVETGADAPTLAEVLRAAEPDRALLVDSLGSWLAAAMYAMEERIENAPVAAGALLEDRVDALVPAFAACAARVVLVSEEVGFGLVPPTPQGRLFRDLLGRANQRLAAIADDVYLVVAGIPLDLKALGAFTARPEATD